MFVIYRDPSNVYEEFVERFSLRKRKENPHTTRNKLQQEANQAWISIKDDEEKINDFLKLRPGEKNFERGEKKKSKSILNFFNPSPAGTSSTKVKSTGARSTNSEADFQILETGTDQMVESDADLRIIEPNADLQVESDAESVNQFVNKSAAQTSLGAKVVEEFLSTFCPKLNTSDVTGHKSFVDSIHQSANTLLLYERSHTKYVSLKTRKMKTQSQLSIMVNETNEKVAKLKDKMDKAANITLNFSVGTAMISVLATQNNNLLLKIVAMSAVTCTYIQENKVVEKMRKRINECQKKRCADSKPDVMIWCLNSDVSWQEAFATCESGTVKSLPSGVSLYSLQMCAHQIEGETVCRAEDLPIDCNTEIIDFLLENFPILLITKSTDMILINIKDFVLDRDTFTTLFIGEEPVNSPNEDTSQQSAPLVSSQQKQIGPMRQQGRKPLWQQFPSLIGVVEEFIKTHTFSAQGRRRESTGTGTGVSLKQIREHVMDKVPGIREKGISRDAIHLLLAPPRKNTIRAERYKSLVDARVPGKRNNYREKNPNQHFLFARIKYCEEFVSSYPSECAFYL